MALGDQQLRILECLDKLSSGVRGQTMGKDMDHPPAVSSAIADQPVTFMYALQASFDAPWEALIPLYPTVRQEQDPTSS